MHTQPLWTEATFSPCRSELAAATNCIRENSDFPDRRVRDRIGIGEGNLAVIGAAEEVPQSRGFTLNKKRQA